MQYVSETVPDSVVVTTDPSLSICDLSNKGNSDDLESFLLQDIQM